MRNTSKAVATALTSQRTAIEVFTRILKEAATRKRIVTEEIAGVATASSETASAAVQMVGAAEEISKLEESLHDDATQFLDHVRRG